jgi:hypothetical protein
MEKNICDIFFTGMQSIGLIEFGGRIYSGKNREYVNV